MGGKVDPESFLYVTKLVSVAYLVTAIGCTGAGVMTLKYAGPGMVFPFSTGSGIWCGVGAFVTSILGLSVCRHFDKDDPKKTKCRLIGMYALVIACITFGSLHLVYSGVSYSFCANPTSPDGVKCNKEERPRLLLIEAFNMAFGVIIFMTSLFFMLYVSIGRKLQAMTGITQGDVRYTTCCFGHCNVEIGNNGVHIVG